MTIEEMEAEIQEMNEAIRKRRRRGLGLMLKPLWMLTMLACLIGSPAVAFIAYDCSNSTNLVEAYSLLEPDACANMGKDGEVETSVYGEVAQVTFSGVWWWRSWWPSTAGCSRQRGSSGTSDSAS